MHRSLLVVVILGLISANQADAQYRRSSQQYGSSYNSSYGSPDWSRSLVKKPHHSFGTVARASKHEHTFEFVNPLRENLVLSSVRASCGCATPTIKTQVVKPGETAKLHVRFNTLAFLGNRKAKITLTVSQPQWVEIYFNIDGFVRKDIVIHPGKVDFGQVVAGKTNQQSVEVKYAGKHDWKIVEVRSNNPALTGSVEETKRQNGLVSYKLNVDLAQSAKAGYLTDEIVLVTNDLAQQEVPVAVNGYVKPVIETTSVVDVGEIMQGETLKRKIILRSADAFAVVDAKCENESISVAPSEKSSKMHIIAVEIAAQKEGKISEEILITTDNDAQKETRVKIIGNVVRSAVVNNE